MNDGGRGNPRVLFFASISRDNGNAIKTGRGSGAAKDGGVLADPDACAVGWDKVKFALSARVPPSYVLESTDD
jgi:hypothetical protein